MAGPVLRWSLEYVKVGSKPLSLFFLIFPQYNILIDYLKYHTMHPVHTHFPFLPRPPLLPLHPTPKREGKKKPQLSSLCVAHTLIGTWVNFLVASPLKDNRTMSLPTPRSHQLWSYTWAFLSRCWRRLTISCLDCHRSLQGLSFSIMSL